MTGVKRPNFPFGECRAIDPYMANENSPVNKAAFRQQDSMRNEMKGKRGLPRLLNATRYSFSGYLTAWRDEEAFRQIAILSAVGIPSAFVFGADWGERILLALPCVLCVLVELLNSAIENVVDRVSTEWHPLSKKAKDMGSAAQFTAHVFLVVVWGSWLIRKLSLGS